MTKGIVPSAFIRQGSRITYMSFKRFRIRFIDSYHFLLQPLKNLSATYDIDTIKGHFRHKFNKIENQNYVGKIPDESEFGVKNMMPNDYDNDFKPWYYSRQLLRLQLRLFFTLLSYTYSQRHT